MTDKQKLEYKCKYCGRKMHKFEYDNYNGYCGKCIDLVEWKRTLEHIKEINK